MRQFINLMRIIVKNYIEPLNIRNFIFLNVLLLFFVKIVVPYAGPGLATILEQINPFDSRGVITETNKVRVANGLTPVQANQRLDLAATDKLNNMITNSYFAHTSPQGITPWYWIDKEGYKYTYAGENLALGFFSADQTVQAWMNSPSHKANLLNPNYRDIGVATGKASINGVTGVLIVQMFGKTNQTVVLPPTATPKPSTATPKPTAKATPRPTPRITPTPTTNVAGSQATITPKPQVKAEAIQLQHVSTDTSIPAVTQAMEFTGMNDVFKSISLAGKLNLLYEIYMVLAIIMFGFAIAFHGFRKSFIVATAFNFGLFFMAISIPSIEVIVKSFIF